MISHKSLTYELEPCHTTGRGQWKMLILSTNVDKKSLETEFSITICRPTNGNQKHRF